MRGSHSRLPTLCAAAAGLLAFAACGDDGTGPGAVTPATGTWSGSTSQARPMSFTVTSQGITSATLEYQLTGTSCGFTGTITVSSSSPVPITNGQFDTGSFPVGSSSTMRATGRFTSATQGNGTISISDGSCGGSVSLTWTASRP
jgi:hypothetical protein